MTATKTGNALVDAAKGNEVVLLQRLLDSTLAIFDACAHYDLPLEHVLAQCLTHPDSLNIEQILADFRSGKLRRTSHAYDSINAVLTEARQLKAQGLQLQKQAEQLKQEAAQTPPDIS